MPEAYKIASYDADGKALSPEELFNAWVQMARNLSASLPAGDSRELCAAVYAAVTAERAKAEGGE